MADDKFGQGFGVAVFLLILVVAGFGVGRCTEGKEIMAECGIYSATTIQWKTFDCKAQAVPATTK